MDWQKEIESVSDELKALLKAKNQNYGGAVFEPPCLFPPLTQEIALLVRMSDKISRIRYLTTGGKDRVGETFEDAVRDLAGYCLLLLALKRNEDKKANRELERSIHSGIEFDDQLY